MNDITPVVETILPALEQFLRFEVPERVMAQRSHWEHLLEEPLPHQGVGNEAVVRTLRDIVIPNGLYCGSPGFSGWVTTMPTTVPVVANLAATVAGAQRKWIQAFNLLEDLALRWLKELIGLPASYQGCFVSGGSTANLIALGAARQYAFEQSGRDPARDGITGNYKPRIYISDEAHNTLRRAAAVLGLGREAIVTIPTDVQFRMNVLLLKQQLSKDLSEGCIPIAIVANAGSVNTGAIDPIADLATLCTAYNVWLHVDGAYGLLGILDPEVTSLYGDLNMAHSLAMDPHKWLGAPVGCGAIFVRDRELLQRAFMQEPASYFEQSQPIYETDEPVACQFDDFGYSFTDFGLEQTAPARGVQVWALLKEIGIEGVRMRIRRHNAYARYLAEHIQSSPCLELLAPVSLSICCFRYVPSCLRGQTDATTTQQLNALNRQILTLIRARGRCMPSATTIRTLFAIRPCYINTRTTLKDVQALLEEVEVCGRALWND